MRVALLVAAISFGLSTVASGSTPLFGPTCGVSSETPGAVAALATEDDVARLDYDFTGGGDYAFLGWEASTTTRTEVVSFSIKCPFRRRLMMRVTDSEGQVFQRELSVTTDIWWRYHERLDQPWTYYYGGACDGRFRGPVTRFELLVLRLREQKNLKGSLRVKDIALERPAPPSNPSVRLWADFTDRMPPSRLEAEVTAIGGAFGGGQLAVRWFDWDDRPIRTTAQICPSLVSGEVWKTSFDYAALPEGKKAIFCKTVLAGEGVRVRTEGPSWVVPPEIQTTFTVDTSSPWGAGIYCHRWGRSEESFKAMEMLADRAVAAGIRWVREEIPLRRIAPKRGEFDFEYDDRIVALLEKRGLSIIMLFQGWPSWTEKGTPDGVSAYCEALETAVRHYRGRIEGWELWNEPNGGDYWVGGEELYRRLLDDGSRAVKRADPKVRTIGCSTSGLGLGFLERMREGVNEDVSIHPYRNLMDEPEYLADLAAASFVSGGRNIWITEIGWTGWPVGYSGMPPQDDFREQAALLARAYMASAASPRVRAVFCYDFVDDGWIACGSEQHLGVLHGEMRKGFPSKAAHRALAKVCKTFPRGGGKMTCAPDGLCTFRCDDSVLAVWSRTEEKADFAVSSAARLTNLMDEPIEAESDGRGGFKVCVDWRHPVFVSDK